MGRDGRTPETLLTQTLGRAGSQGCSRASLVLPIPTSILAILPSIAAGLPSLAEYILNRSSILIPIWQTNLEARKTDDLRCLSRRCGRRRRAAIVYRRSRGRGTRLTSINVAIG
jgi:hypothetical protein